MTTGGRTTRRGFQRKLALVAASGLLSIGTTIPSSRSALALSHLMWTVTDATIASDDGTISELTLGDSDGADDDVIHVSYGGLNDPPTDIEFEIRLRGTNQGDGGWASGNDETTWEPLTTGSVEVTQHTDEETYSWEEIFGEPTPVDVTDHSEIVLDDFEAPQAATTTEQVLEVEIRARIPEENEVSAAATATATISVTNPTSTVRIGFEEGQFETTTETDETVFMTDGEASPQPVDIDVSAFNSATVTINGAGGANGTWNGGRGGRIVAELDLSGIETLRAWAAEEGPTGQNGGWGGFNGGGGGFNNAGGGAGSSHLAIGDSISDSLLIADGGGGGATNRGQGHGGGGGARGGAGGSASSGNDGQRGNGEGFGGAGGSIPSLGTAQGGPGGQEANDALGDLSVLEEQIGGGNANHADITLELTIDEWG